MIVAYKHSQSRLSDVTMNTAEHPLDKTFEELYQERTEVLFRAGQSVSRILSRMTRVDEAIHSAQKELTRQGIQYPNHRELDHINTLIDEYNKLRDEAKLRYYYLIVTRESIGFLRHDWVEKFYPVPARKKPVENASE